MLNQVLFVGYSTAVIYSVVVLLEIFFEALYELAVQRPALSLNGELIHMT